MTITKAIIVPCPDAGRSLAGRARIGSRGIRCGSAALACIGIALLLTLLPALCVAHPPKEVVLTYNQPKRMLEVRITHDTSEPAKHFVSSVEIKKDGKTISRNEFRSQPGQATFVYSYPLEPFPDGAIEVTAKCSVSGSMTEKLDMRKIPR